MKNKVFIITLLVFLLVLPFVLGEYSYIYKQNALVDFKIPCYDTNYNLCNSNTNCSLSVVYPNGTTLISNATMTSANSFYNYTIPANSFSTIGEYPSFVNCVGETDSGITSFNIKITKHGDDSDQKTDNVSFIMLSLFFGIGIIILIVWIIRTQALWLKTCLSLALSIMIMSLVRFIAWFVEIITPNQIELIDTLYKFYMFSVWGFRMTMIASIFILLIIVLNAMKPTKKGNTLRGFDNL